MWGRWQYWSECQLLPDIAWKRWQWENTIALIENRKPEAIPKFVIEHALPDREIPQISWSYNEQAEKMLIDCLDAIPVSGGWNSWSSWSYLRSHGSLDFKMVKKIKTMKSSNRSCLSDWSQHERGICSSIGN